MALVNAEALVTEHSVISLSPDAAQAFSDALTQPAAVNERLAAALDCPRGFRWVDCSRSSARYDGDLGRVHARLAVDLLISEIDATMGPATGA